MHTQAEGQQQIQKKACFQIYSHLIPWCNFLRNSILSKENRFRNKKSFSFLKFPVPIKVFAFFFPKPTKQPTNQPKYLASRVSMVWCLLPDLINVQFITPVPHDFCDLSQLFQTWKFQWGEEKNSSQSSVKVTVGISAGSYIIYYRYKLNDLFRIAQKISGSARNWVGAWMCLRLFVFLRPLPPTQWLVSYSLNSSFCVTGKGWIQRLPSQTMQSLINIVDLVAIQNSVAHYVINPTRQNKWEFNI